ncbi:TetR family transcriptional regulator [Actinomycetota bacterium]
MATDAHGSPDSGLGPQPPSTTAVGATDGRSTRWAAHRTARRRELVEATLRAIRDHGADLGIDEIASAAGTSKTVIYRHFTDRAGLYAAVADHVNALILRDLNRAVGDPKGASPLVADTERDGRAVIAAAITAYLALVEKDPEVYRFVMRAPLLAPAERGRRADPAGEVTAHISDAIGDVLSAALTASDQDPTPARLWGTGVVGMVRAAADQWLTDRRSGTSTQGRDELAALLTDLAWHGLSPAWGAPAHRRHVKGA